MTVPPTRITEKQIDRLVTELRELSTNLWWSWNPGAQQLFRELSPFFWDHGNHNPVEVLQWVSGPELRARLETPAFFRRATDVCSRFRAYRDTKKTWASSHAPALARGPVAYFSAEFGLHESLRIYSGGLGILAGDHTKSASDLGLPFVGVGLLYNQGYFQQQVSPDGWQQELYPTYDPARLPLTPVTDKRGVRIRSVVNIGNTAVHFQAWRAQVGRVPLFLLDTNLPDNEPRFRELTAHVYGGDRNNRIGQEIMLGIGGVRLLRALDIAPSVFHMNEGHAAFLTLELLREQLGKGLSPEKAEAAVKSHCIFTTHTPVPAGHDRFERPLMEANFGHFASTLGMSMEQFLGYGRVNPADHNELFCVTVLALKMSRAANGVSELNGKVSRQMWMGLYPGAAEDDVPIGAVTNGVHMTGWCTPTAMEFWSARAGAGWADILESPTRAPAFLAGKKVSDADLWTLRTALRRELIEFVRRRLREQHLRLGENGLGLYDNVLSPDALTIGFARRFATYKRAPLFFRDLEWAIRTLTDERRPVQLIFAGKAHPRDDAGKHFIQQIVGMTKRLDLFGRVVFLENYDINVARHLVAGSDIWLNTPRRPMEACGTSGMKTLVHGVLNVSTMDGWWREAYDGRNGWKIGEDAQAHDEHTQDDQDAASLRKVLGEEVIPLFYRRGKDGIPHEWLKRVRHSMATLIPRFNTSRMVAEYTTKYYLTEMPKKARRG